MTRDKAICCDLCSKWIHIKCNNLNDLDHEYLKSKDETWYKDLKELSFWLNSNKIALHVAKNRGYTLQN